MLNQYLQFPPSAPPGGAGGWNPADTSSNVSTLTFSNSDKTVLHSGGSCSVRSTDPKTSGKWYCELKIDAAGASVTDDYPGVIDSTTTLANQWTSNVGFIAIRGNGVFFITGPALYSFPGVGLNTGDVIGMAVDVGTNVKFYFNNTLIETVPFTVASVAVLGNFDGGATGAQYTLNLAAADHVYSAPAGYSSWL